MFPPLNPGHSGLQNPGDQGGDERIIQPIGAVMRSPASARSIPSTAAKAAIGQTTSENGAGGPAAGEQIHGPLCSPAPANDQTGAGCAASPDGSTHPCEPIADKSSHRFGPARGPVATPKGIAFDIAELLLVQAWAEANDVTMRIYLDHGSRAEEYEEAIAIQPRGGPVGRSLIWRNQAYVYVQPLLGRRRRYTSVSAAVESLAPEGRVSVTDIVAKSWPKD